MGARAEPLEDAFPLPLANLPFLSRGGILRFGQVRQLDFLEFPVAGKPLEILIGHGPIGLFLHAPHGDDADGHALASSSS